MDFDSQQMYSEIIEAYDYLNKCLFAGVLPGAAITLTRHAKAYGYFATNAFKHRHSGEYAPEIALNPDHFLSRTDDEVLATLAHEMCHQWQHKNGKPSRAGYHNKEFAAIMKGIGLICSDTGLPGGKPTGQKMTHYIAPDGPFQEAVRSWKQTHITDWGSVLQEKTGTAKATSKVKYTCPDCGLNAWAKPAANLLCGDCSQNINDFCFMYAEPLF